MHTTLWYFFKRVYASFWARQLVKKLVRDWGTKPAYSITEANLLLLIQAGATVVQLNYDEGDGTFTHEVRHWKRTFLVSTRTRVSPSRSQ